MVDIPSISVAIAAASVVIGTTYYSLILRNANRTRKTQLFMQIYDRFNDREFQKCWVTLAFHQKWSDFEDWKNKYGPGNIEQFSAWITWGAYLAGIGVLVKQKLVDVNQVFNLMASYIIWSWETYKPIIEGLVEERTIPIRARRAHDVPQFGYWLEYLYNEMLKVEQHRGKASK